MIDAAPSPIQEQTLAGVVNKLENLDQLLIKLNNKNLNHQEELDLETIKREVSELLPTLHHDFPATRSFKTLSVPEQVEGLREALLSHAQANPQAVIDPYKTTAQQDFVSVGETAEKESSSSDIYQNPESYVDQFRPETPFSQGEAGPQFPSYDTVDQVWQAVKGNSIIDEFGGRAVAAPAPPVETSVVASGTETTIAAGAAAPAAPATAGGTALATASAGAPATIPTAAAAAGGTAAAPILGYIALAVGIVVLVIVIIVLAVNAAAWMTTDSGSKTPVHNIIPGTGNTGCWPATGYISQAMQGGHATHCGKDNDVELNHQAVDIADNAGTPIFTPYAGTILLVVDDQAGSTVDYGNRIVIHATEGFDMVFAHLSSVNFTPADVGKQVTADQHIGNMGSTGNSTGSHLHFEITDWSSCQNTTYLRDVLPSTPELTTGNTITNRCLIRH